MKHLLNNLSEEEKNRIREQHEGGMKVNTERFKSLLESKSGNVKPLLNEQTSLNVDSLYNIANDVLREKRLGTSSLKQFENSVRVLGDNPAELQIYIGNENGNTYIKIFGSDRNNFKVNVPTPNITTTSSNVRYNVPSNDLKSKLGDLLNQVKTNYDII